MARPRQPISLLEAKGKKHLTKAEIESRRQSELKASVGEVAAPSYLSAKEKREFKKIAGELVKLNIMSILDCDGLARYIQSESKYLAYDKMVNRNLAQIRKNTKTMEMFVVDTNMLKDLESLRDRALKQCRVSASDLGLTISSRCKLVIPQKEEAIASKWDSYKVGGGSG